MVFSSDFLKALGIKFSKYGYIEVINKNQVHDSSYYESKNYESRDLLKKYEKDHVYYKNYHTYLGVFLQDRLSLLDRNFTIVDFGCGVGHSVEGFKIAGYQSYGIEVSKLAVSHSKKMLRDVRHGGMECINSISQPNTLLYSKNVLEHIVHPETFFQSVFSSKKIDYLLISVPNDFNPLQLKANNIVQNKFWWVDIEHHANYFNREGLINLAKRYGFKEVFSFTTYPLELAILSGSNYVDNKPLGRYAHKVRTNYEDLFKNYVFDIYEQQAKSNIGRDLCICFEKIIDK